MTDAAANSHSGPVILAVFVATYLGLAAGRVPGLKLDRSGIALLGAIALMAFAGISTGEVVSYINWPTICLLFGFSVISAQLRLSGFYDQVANAIASRLGHPAKFLLLLMLAAAGLSAFLNNDIVCYVFAPVVGAALLRQRLNPVPFLIALAIASNIGAGATLIGNPQNMMIGEVTHLGFGPYLAWSIVPVVASLVLAYGLIWLLSRKQLQPVAAAEGETKMQSYPYDRAHTIKGLVILVVAVGMFFSSVPREVIALAAAGFHLASPKYRTEDLLRLVEWPILILFIGLFAVTGAFEATGYGDQAVHWLAHAGFNLNLVPNLVLATAALSNLISNAAAVMLLLKVVDHSHPVTAYVLALANSFGGSLLVIGSVSSLIVVQQARDLGIKISFRDFARLGIPVTLVTLGGLILWALVMG